MKNKIILLLLAISFAPLNAQCWKSFSAGEEHSVSLLSNGTMWNWGWNPYGQLGDGTIVDRSIPTQIGVQTDWKIIANQHASHTLAIKNNGTLWGWGLNQSGQAGSLNYTNASGYILIPTQIGSDTDWKIIITGNKHSAAIKNDGTLWTWGRNEDGQLGIGNKVNQDNPVKVGTDNNWVNVSAGDAHTIAIKQDGTIWSWGRNGDGQLGIGNNTPTTIPTKIGTLNTWTDVFAGGAFCIAKKNDGTIWSFGNNSLGELGIGNNIDKNSPTQIGTANDWNTIATGGLHTIALKNNGDIWSWGINIDGELGDGTMTNRNYPLKIQSLTNVAQISAGSYHSMVISNGKMYNWGDNYGGQLGNGLSGNGNDITTPVLLNCPIALGSSETGYESDWVFYPNPAKDIIQFNPNLEISNCYAVDGKYIKMIATGYQLNVSKLVTGNYILVFKDKNGKSISKKLMKK